MGVAGIVGTKFDDRILYCALLVYVYNRSRISVLTHRNRLPYDVGISKPPSLHRALSFMNESAMKRSLLARLLSPALLISLGHIF